MTQPSLYYPRITSELTWSEGNQWQSKSSWIKVTINGDDYSLCSEVKIWSSTKTSRYGKGLGNTADDPLKVERTGKLGEMAFAKLCGLGVDMTYREFGDDCDFALMGLKIDVKTRMINEGFGLIYAVAPGGRPIKLNCDRYVFAHIENDDLQNKTADIVVTGYIKKSHLDNKPPVRGWRNSGHKNYLIYYYEMEPIERIVSAVRKDIPIL